MKKKKKNNKKKKQREGEKGGGGVDRNNQNSVYRIEIHIWSQFEQFITTLTLHL